MRGGREQNENQNLKTQTQIHERKKKNGRVKNFDKKT